MTIETEVGTLTTSVNALAAATDVRKSTLDTAVAATETSASIALAAQVATNTSATTAATAATNAIAIYGSNAAQQTAIATTQAQADIASAAAASASSVLQQDLTGVTAQALHRSPNAVTSMFIYDTSKDTDGGAWTEKCQHTSWYNEPIMGKWLGPQENERNARFQGATLGTSLGDPYESVSGWTVSAGAVPTISAGWLAFNPGVGSAWASRDFSTVAGRTYRLTGTFRRSASNVNIFAGTGSGAGQFGSITLSASGAFVFYFTATGTTSNVGVQSVSGTLIEFQLGALVEVTAITTQSSDYFQLTTDGKFYRLWKNLFSYSQTFNSTFWNSGYNGGTFVPNAIAAPDGSLTATKLVPNSGATSVWWGKYDRNTVPIIAGQSYTFSSYLKAGEYSTVDMDGDVRDAGGVTMRSSFTLTGNGSVTTTSGTASIVSVGNGWYRCSITSVADSNVLEEPAWVISGIVGNGSNGFYVWGPQFEIGSVATTYEPKGVETSTSEVFRGNKRDFPRLAGLVAESNFVTIYDLTEPGRPMWMRFVGTTYANTTGSALFVQGGYVVSNLCALNGLIGVSATVISGLSLLEFPADKATIRYQYLPYAVFRGNLAQRNASLGYETILSSGTAPTTPVNAIAMTVLPDAPTDPVTGIKVPTIALATNGGVSIVTSDGKVVNLTHNQGGTGIARAVSFLEDGKIVWGSDVSGSAYTSFYHVNKIPSVSTDYGNYFNPNPTNLEFYASRSWGGGTPVVRFAGSDSYMRSNILADQKNKVFLFSDYFLSGVHGVQRRPRLNGTGGAFTITPTYNTGWMHGDIRRAYLSDTTTGVAGTDLITNGTFTTDLTGWTTLGTAVAELVSGEVKVSGPNTYALFQQVVTVVPGRDYIISCKARRGTTNEAWLTIGSASNSGGNIDYINTPSATTITLTRRIKPTVSTIYVSVGTGSVVGDAFFDDVSVREYMPDRSYKAGFANINGTLTRSQLASGASLVGYSGWSAANYMREPYSADLDFGTGEWAASAWVNVPVTMPVGNFPVGGGELVSNGTFDTDLSGWTNSNFTWVDGKAVSNGGNCNLSQTLPVTIGKTYKVTATYSAAVAGGSTLRVSFLGDVVDITTSVTKIVTALNTSISITAFGSPATYQGAIDNISVVEVSHTLIASRAHSSGPRVLLGIDGTGKLTTTAFDGTTTRTVTTTAAYNTAQWLKTEANYTTDGSLAIRVNGREVAVTRGNPLLTLNNTSATLTIGNSFAADAPFPGSIALLKLGATVPTAEQSTFMYEQEKQLFRDNAVSILPDATGIIDMSYDDTTDRWVAISATNESYWAGLVRSSVTPVSAGSYSKITTTSGVELAARITSYPGVDITIPSYVIREELVKRSETAANLNNDVSGFDYVGGFTASTTTGSTAITSVANLTYPTSYIGARITGAGIPANAVITAVSGTTIYISAAATATATGVSMTFLDFNLPTGMQTKSVTTGNAIKQEGATKDYTRLFDGFIETVRFAVAPGATAWVRIQAIKVNV